MCTNIVHGISARYYSGFRYRGRGVRHDRRGWGLIVGSSVAKVQRPKTDGRDPRRCQRNHWQRESVEVSAVSKRMAWACARIAEVGIEMGATRMQVLQAMKRRMNKVMVTVMAWGMPGTSYYKETCSDGLGVDFGYGETRKPIGGIDFLSYAFDF
ncbi:hypothetical protein OF83DRAFT_1080219 [Amylostereum chailletii]|nr:hypothetical protein OF83DRAFT_1080219 [Amylostereum chailletii]